MRLTALAGAGLLLGACATTQQSGVPVAKPAVASAAAVSKPAEAGAPVPAATAAPRPASPSKPAAVTEKPASIKTQDNFSALSNAIALYYSDQQGFTPKAGLKGLTPQYIKAIPDDGMTGSNKVVAAFDGTGGWVYEWEKGRIAPNLKGVDAGGKPWKELWSTTLLNNP